MKKIIVMAFAAFSLAACNNAETHNATVDTEDTTTTTKTSTTISAAYTPEEGEVNIKELKLRCIQFVTPKRVNCFQDESQLV